MEVKEFSKKGKDKIMLIPGTMMNWRQFDTVIPYLEKGYHIIAVSTDGFDGSGDTVFTTAEASARKIAEYINSHLDGNIQLVFGESFGCASAAALFNSKLARVDAMILNGAQCMDFGIFTDLIMDIIPKNQYSFIRKLERTKKTGKMPVMMKLFTHTKEQNMMDMLGKISPNISLETLENCVKEAKKLYKDIERYTPDKNAKVSIWYGAKEPNMKKAIKILRSVYPNAEEHPFRGLGHGEVIAHPKYMAKEIIKFMESRDA